MQDIKVISCGSKNMDSSLFSEKRKSQQSLLKDFCVGGMFDLTSQLDSEMWELVAYWYILWLAAHCSFTTCLHLLKAFQLLTVFVEGQNKVLTDSFTVITVD